VSPPALNRLLVLAAREQFRWAVTAGPESLAGAGRPGWLFGFHMADQSG